MRAPLRPSRLLIVLPSWVGDTVMATPTLRALRSALPGAFIGGLMRPGLDALLNGTGWLDEVHLERAAGMMGPKHVAARVRLQRYDAAILLTNSFSTALTVRLAGIPCRIGYDRDARGLLLTDRLSAPRRREVEPYRRSRTAPSEWAPIPACGYYFALAQRLLDRCDLDAGPMGAMELSLTGAEREAANVLLKSLGIEEGPVVMLNPGGNDPAKRWPAEQFAALAAYLARKRGTAVLVSGAPSESELTARIAAGAGAAGSASVIDLPAAVARVADFGAGPLGLLKALIARCALMVTNDTGPRHIAAALGVPVVSLFGPTDHRWTTIPFDRERLVFADPDLPLCEVANDHPQRCAIDRITLERVVAAVHAVSEL